MSTIAVIGAGDLGRQATSMFLAQGGRADAVHLFDDGTAQTTWCTMPVERQRPFTDWRQVDGRFDAVLVGVGYRHLGVRHEIVRTLLDRGVHLTNCVHPSAVVPPGVLDHQRALLVYAGAVIDEHVQLAPGVVLNVGATVCHDSSIGAATFLAPRALLCGGVTIGARSFVGAGAIVRNGTMVGDDCLVGLGSHVQADVPDRCHVVGSPAREREALVI